MLLLGNHLHEKSITESQDRQSFDCVHMLFVICTYVTTLHFCFNFAPVLYEKCTYFQLIRGV